MMPNGNVAEDLVPPMSRASAAAVVLAVSVVRADPDLTVGPALAVRSTGAAPIPEAAMAMI